MDHPEIREKLFAYYDGELAASDRTLVKLHLYECADCRGELERWAQASHAVLEPLRAPATEYFVQNVMRRIRIYVEDNEGQRWQAFVRWALPALAFAATGFAAIFLYTMWPTEVSSGSEILTDSNASATVSWSAPMPSEDPLTLAMFRGEQ
jgi:anti-sigma factor RsiW